MILRLLVAASAAERRRLAALLPTDLARTTPAAGGVGPALRRGTFDLLVVDRARLGADPGRLVATAAAAPGAPGTIVLCATEDPADRAHLLTCGVLAVLNHALDDRTLGEALRALIARRREDLLLRLRARARAAPLGLRDFVSRSPAMQRFLAVAARVVETDSTLLIQGETGVGKELLARAMHDEGPRRGGPFVAVNCAAIPEALLESELFGHEAGAFTGAVNAHRGYFELAHGGTVFLDEVGEMPQPLQAKVLRLLQDHRIRPVGAEQDLPVDVRVVAATNRDLLREVRAGRYRADLYYRLAVVALTIPPLRERRSDIPDLVQNHLEELLARFKKTLTVPADVMAALQAHDWPGNVRELVNVLERAVLLADGGALSLADLPDAVVRAAPDATAGVPPELFEQPLDAALAKVTQDFERAYLERLLRACGGRVGRTAVRAGISPRSLWDRMRRHGLSRGDFRDGEATG